MNRPPTGVYHPRNPKASPLFGLVEDHFDRFEGLYDERFAKTHGHWRPVVRKVADAFLDCGDLRHGFARIGCENPECRHEMLLAFSCRSRYFCPSCHAKRVALFASRLESEVLAAVPHRQYVLTIPKLLRLHFRFDRRLLGLLSACAYQSILEMMRAVVSEPGAVPGMVASIQTYGDRAANWHPHLHTILTDGVFLPDGSFRSLPPPDREQLLLLFRHKLVKRLLKLEKITPTTVEILDRFRHPGFSVFQGPPIQADDSVAREKLAIYMVHPPVALERMDYLQADGVVFHSARPAATAHQSAGRSAGPDGSLRLDPLESLAALTDHIPDRGQHLVRAYGWYSNKNRGLRKKRAAITKPTTATSLDESASMGCSPAGNAVIPSRGDPLDCPDDDFRKDCRRTWARMLKKVYQVDPLICPRCGFPLRVLSLIEDPPVVRRILDHLGLWDQQRPPPADFMALEFIRGVWPQVAEDPYPYDQTGWASDEPA